MSHDAPAERERVYTFITGLNERGWNSSREVDKTLVSSQTLSQNEHLVVVGMNMDVTQSHDLNNMH